MLSMELHSTNSESTVMTNMSERNSA